MCTTAILLNNICTYNIIVDSINVLLNTGTMSPFAKILCISAVTRTQNIQLMEDTETGLAETYQNHIYQFVDLTIEQIEMLTNQRHVLLLFDDYIAFRYNQLVLLFFI